MVVLYVCLYVCVYVCGSIRSFLPPCASRHRKIVIHVFTATQKKVYNQIFAKTASFKIYCHLLASNSTNYF